MTNGQKSKLMDVLTGDPRSADTDLVIVSAFEEQIAALGSWSAPTGRELERAVETKEFSGKLFEHFLTPITDSAFRPRRLAVMGLGQQSDFTIDRVRRSATAVALLARQKIPRLTVVADGALASADMVQAIAEGLTLAEFDAGRYKTAGYEPFDLQRLAILVPDASPSIDGSRRNEGV